MSDTLTPAEQWKDFFYQWPKSIPTRGIVTNDQNEQMPFKSFMTKGEMLLLERTNPDAAGGRFIIIPFATISSLKLTDPIRESDALAAGFAGKFAK